MTSRKYRCVLSVPKSWTCMKPMLVEYLCMAPDYDTAKAMARDEAVRSYGRYYQVEAESHDWIWTVDFDTFAAQVLDGR